MSQAVSDVNELAPTFKDRTVGLVIFGVLQIVLGLFCALEVLVLASVFVLSFAGHTPEMAAVSPVMLLPGLLVYVAGFVWFVTMGIGSIRARRWARTLTLVSSWLWLVMGLVGMAVMLMVMPRMYDKMAENGQVPQEMVFFIKTFMVVTMVIICGVIPGTLVLFYRGRNVKATCEFKDTKTRWTDTCPPPVLAVSLLLGSNAVLLGLSAAVGVPVPVLGQIATGWFSAVVLAVSAAAFAYAAWATCKLKMSGWWCVVVLLASWTASTAYTFTRVSLVDLYRAMNMPQQQLDLTAQILPQMKVMAWYYGLVFAGFLGYLVYIRKYFKTPLTIART